LDYTILDGEEGNFNLIFMSFPTLELCYMLAKWLDSSGYLSV